MKKIFACIAIASFAFSSCRKEAGQSGEEESLSKKYAKYRSWVYADRGLKKELTPLNTAESVDLISLEKTAPGKEAEIAKIRLTDGTTGYLRAENLAEKPVVFIEHTKAFMKHNTGSQVYATIPAGAIGFIIDEKADWVRIYVGKVGDKWVNGHWVKSGYREDDGLIIDAKKYGQALKTLDSDQSGDRERAAAVNTLMELARSKNVFSRLAKEKLSALNINTESPVSGEAKKDGKKPVAPAEDKKEQ